MGETDLISRQAAIEAIKTWGLLDGLSEGQAIEILADEEKLPSVQPEIPSYVTEIESEYKRWVSMPFINKPLAKALYEVWKKHDREDVSRNG